MTPKIKEAIGRLRATKADGGGLSGTAFLVSDRYLLTAFHVVGDRAASASTGNPVLYSALWFDHAGMKGAAVKVSVVPGACDPVSDWALLETQAPMTGIDPLPLGEVSRREIEQRKQQQPMLQFASWGFAKLAHLSGSGIAITGVLQDRDALYQDAWAYQLFSDNAAAAFGAPLSGLSGAPCLIDGAAVGIIRSNLIDPDTKLPAHTVGGILYACPVATSTLQERCAQYLPSLDPIRGLPGLPRQPLPLEPFRYLHWYGAEHAEVFFGRNQKLRDLYFQITDANTPSVVLVYGASGVGKSSFLEAGLLPRLSWNYEVRAQRRETSKALVQSLDEQLASARSASQSSGKPIILLLDQIDEVFTDPRVDGNTEVAALGQSLQAIISGQGQVPRIILSFRSEWLANVRARLAEAKIPISEFFLERLTRDEIEEVVLGVVSTERIKQFYGVDVDEDLPKRVADDLLSDPTSPVSPVLSIILTRLWAEAKKNLAGKQSLSVNIFEQRMRNRLDLNQFLIDQTNAVALTRPDDVASGLVNDVLYRHTTDYGTAKELSWRELRKLYYHLGNGEDHSYLRDLITALRAQSLLYSIESKSNSDSPDDQMTRLAHDTLAPPVRKNYDQSELPGQRAERRLASWVEDWRPSAPESGALDAASLALIEDGARGMRGPTNRESDFIRASKTAISSARKRWWGERAAVAGILLVALGGLLATWQGVWLKEQWYSLTQVNRVHQSQEAALTPLTPPFSECTHCPQMVVIPYGRSFIMGGPADGKGDPNEYPRHEVTISRPFAVAKSELKFEEWQACVDYGDCPRVSESGWGGGRQPVINVSWNDAQRYVNWLKSITRKPYRLLTEAEWEYAARGNKGDTHFWFGNDETVLGDHAWYTLNSNNQPHPVEGRKANPFGLYDMYGNVAEWVEDCDEKYRGVASDQSAKISGNCGSRIVRGGSWRYYARLLRSASRRGAPSDQGDDDIGFRVARDIVRNGVAGSD